MNTRLVELLAFLGIVAGTRMAGRMRFGLVALDERTQRRTPRRSAALYSAIAYANALAPEMEREYATERG